MATLPIATPATGSPAIATTGASIPSDVSVDDPAGYRICIEVGTDGSLSVGLDGGEYVACEDIKAALTEALRIYKSDGHLQAAQDDLEAGFRSVT